MDESLCKLPSGVKIVMLTPSQYLVEKWDEDFIVNWYNQRNQSDSACQTLDQFINEVYPKEEVEEAVEIIKD